jgi:hypothetical protein
MSWSAREQVLDSEADAHHGCPGDGVDDEVVGRAHDDEQGGHGVDHR